jgi:hypothetical protein
VTAAGVQGPAADDVALAAIDDIAMLPGVPEAVESARVACEQLRWHEAYRRRWREVRLESGVRVARAGAAIDGARIPLDVVRAIALGAGPPDGSSGAGVGVDHADLLVARGALRAAAVVEAWMPNLGARGSVELPPLAHLLSRLHGAAGAGWLPDAAVGRLRTDDAPQDLRGLGPAPTGPESAARIALLGRIARDSRASALVVAAVVHGELLAVRPFAAGNGIVARGVSRLLVTARGLDPTGSVVPEAVWAEAPNAYLGAAAGFATGNPAGVGAWVRACAEAVVTGAEAARDVADAVVARRLTR